jgi:hypothetical protein
MTRLDSTDAIGPQHDGVVWTAAARVGEALSRRQKLLGKTTAASRAVHDAPFGSAAPFDVGAPLDVGAADVGRSIGDAASLGDAAFRLIGDIDRVAGAADVGAIGSRIDEGAAFAVGSIACGVHPGIAVGGWSLRRRRVLFATARRGERSHEHECASDEGGGPNSCSPEHRGSLSARGRGYHLLCAESSLVR